MACAGIKFAIAWIAENDNAGMRDNVEDIAGYVTVCLVADLFGKSTADIAERVYTYRQNRNQADNRQPTV